MEEQCKIGHDGPIDENPGEDIKTILMQGTPFFHSLTPKQQYVYATYMMFPDATRPGLVNRVEEVWGVKVSCSTVDYLMAKEGFQQESEDVFEALLTGPRLVAVLNKTFEYALTKEGHQDRKLLFKAAGKIKSIDESSSSSKKVKNVVLEFPCDRTKDSDNE